MPETCFSASRPRATRPISWRPWTTARQKGVITVGMTGRSGGKLAGLCDHLLCAPSDSTPRIQEGHILMGHIVCQLIEAQIFPRT
jgi:D-sedoheptulose 7-phosphate isomerase